MVKKSGTIKQCLKNWVTGDKLLDGSVSENRFEKQ
jgi:hypothetical protein